MAARATVRPVPKYVSFRLKRAGHRGEEEEDTVAPARGGAWPDAGVKSLRGERVFSVLFLPWLGRPAWVQKTEWVVKKSLGTAKTAIVLFAGSSRCR